MRKRFFSLFLALIMLFALLPAFAGTAKAEATKINEIQLDCDGKIAVPKNGESFSASALESKINVESVNPAGLESALRINVNWYKQEDGKYYTTGTFTPGTWELYVYVYVKDSAKYEIDYSELTNTGYYLFEIQLGGLDFRISGCSKTSIAYRTWFTVGVTETTIPIEEVIGGIRTPIVGEHPDYEPWVEANAHCYSMNNTHDNWKNDVIWRDVTDSKHMKPDEDVFKAGHKYSLTFYLTPEEGYAFTDDIAGVFNDGEIVLTATNRDDLTPKQASFSYTFYPDETIAAASVTITPPKVGAKPDYEPAVPDDALYIVKDVDVAEWQNGVAWGDLDTNQYLEPGVDTFEPGHEYWIEISMEPVYGFTFTNKTTGTLNGKLKLTPNYWPYNREIIFVYTFPKLEDPKYNGTVMIDPDDVQLNGKTPYRVYDGKAQKPGVIVKDKSGKVVAASKYTVSYRDNTNPGTAYADVTMKDTGAKASVWFKIYLPPTTSTAVENVENGIQISWKKVDGAKGYVIYRRAWNLVDKGWTKFERWNNTTKTTWTDTKVYAGTRYQYGVKAYFSDAMDNYNLGIVGPLKTTVRITTRTLNSVTPGSKKLTVKWSGSKLFTGYEVQVATDANFTKDVKTVTVKKAKTYETTVKSLKKATTYFVRVRSYHVFEGMTYYGGWSNVLKGKTK